MQNLELFIARRVHFSKTAGESRATPPAIRIAMAGIAVGLCIMLLSVAIVTGFKKEVRNKVIGFGSHIQISRFDSNTSFETVPLMVNDSLMDELRAWPDVRRVERFALTPGMIKTETECQGFVLKGVDEHFDGSFFRKYLTEGELFTVDPEKTGTDVLISHYLANRLGLKCGDSFVACFVQEAEQIRARKLRIRGIYDTGYLEYDKLYVLTDIKLVIRLKGWERDAVSGLELSVNDYDRLDDLSEALYFHLIDRTDRLGNMFYVRSVKELNPMIFNWLDVLDINVVVMLALMMAVSGFTMISGLLIVILERTRMIGILKALGQEDRSLRRVFLYIASFLIGKGMMWGNAIALAVCFIQSRFHLIGLDPSSYYLDTVPVDLSFTSWLLVNLGTGAVSMLMMLGPSCLITKIHPARTIRFE
ncbi:MAG: ABC transporter permease [Tannerella sp.]|jgi:lipoprotein-releasing system permease protein|nr:ABC transporter permease [Tannerella sp.]